MTRAVVSVQLRLTSDLASILATDANRAGSANEILSVIRNPLPIALPLPDRLG
jgi:hypothetical protein